MAYRHDAIRIHIERIERARARGASVQQACKAEGISRDTFYRYQRRPDEQPRRIVNLPNRVTAEVEAAVLDAALAEPTLGQAKVAQLVAATGVMVSASGVYSILQRHGLTRAVDRIAAARTKINNERSKDSMPEDLVSVVDDLTARIEAVEAREAARRMVSDSRRAPRSKTDQPPVKTRNILREIFGLVRDESGQLVVDPSQVSKDD
jgi:transposase